MNPAHAATPRRQGTRTTKVAPQRVAARAHPTAAGRDYLRRVWPQVHDTAVVPHVAPAWLASAWTGLQRIMR
jgi:hypothetical protein